ncbi:MAG: hypothetical protein LBI87_00880 [Candidatus Accumulibacter sp.]|jgi:hypothetical protein|nr:hypothetical protein [Accumulibacter sp.]
MIAKEQPYLLAMSQIKLLCTPDMFRRVDLIPTENGYQLHLQASKKTLIVARRDGDKPRCWLSVDRALMYIREHLGSLDLIYLHLKEQP